jgi:hypothetical protein
MKFFTRKASRVLRTAKGEEKWERVWKQYKEHLKHIRPKLSKGWRKVAAANFHDSRVFSFGPLQESSQGAEYIVNIDMNPGWKRAPLFICSLHFFRVRSVELPSKVLEDYIVYDEVHLASKNTREWRALLTRSQLRIQAEEVAFILNHEPLA